MLAALALLQSAQAASPANLRVLQIAASNQKGAADPKLAPYEAQLQRNLPESSFRLVAEHSAPFSNTGDAKIDLIGGNHLEVERRRGGSGIQLKVAWTRRGKQIVAGTFDTEAGVLVLVRRLEGDADLSIAILVAK